MQTTTVLDCPRCAGPATISILESPAADTQLPRHEIRYRCPRRCAVDDAELLRLWVLARMHELESWSDGWAQHDGTIDGTIDRPSVTSTRLSV